MTKTMLETTSVVALSSVTEEVLSGLPSDWGVRYGQGMTGRASGWLGIKNGVGFTPGGG
jgi:hypothetical protein